MSPKSMLTVKYS